MLYFLLAIDMKMFVHSWLFPVGSRGISVVNFVTALSCAGAATVAAVLIPSAASSNHCAVVPVSTMVEVLEHLQEAYNNWSYLGGRISGSGAERPVSFGNGTGESGAAAVFLQLVTSERPRRMQGGFTDGAVTALDSSGSYNSSTVQLERVRVVYDEQSGDLNALRQLNASRQQVGKDFDADTFYVTVTRDAPTQCYYVTPGGFVEQLRLGGNGVVSFYHPQK